MGLSRILQKPSGKHTWTVDNHWLLPSQLIGYEAEYEGVGNHNLPDHTHANFFQYHPETSLKDNGAEYVFNQPMFGTDAYNAISWLTEYAKEQKWKCSQRCGIHVHLDVRDLEVRQLAGLCILYAALEPVLYKWIGGNRETSHFCIPLYKADDALLKLCNIIRLAHSDEEAGTSSALKAAKAIEEQRYAGLNANALAKFGSLEFRHLATTHDLERITDWVNIIMSLKATAFKLPQSDGSVVRMLSAMDAWEILSYVFPENLCRKLYTKDSNKLIHEVGIPSARDIAVHGCQPLNWEKFIAPKGENAGFLKWIKDNDGKGAKKRTLAYYDEAVADIPFPEDFDVDENPPVAPEPIAPEQVQAVAPGNINWFGEIPAGQGAVQVQREGEDLAARREILNQLRVRNNPRRR